MMHGHGHEHVNSTKKNGDTDTAGNTLTCVYIFYLENATDRLKQLQNLSQKLSK